MRQTLALSSLTNGISLCFHLKNLVVGGLQQRFKTTGIDLGTISVTQLSAGTASIFKSKARPGLLLEKNLGGAKDNRLLFSKQYDIVSIVLSTVFLKILGGQTPLGGKIVLGGVPLPPFSRTATATPAIFFSQWQLDILKAVLQQKSNAAARIARCPQYLQHVAKKLSSMNILQHCPSDFVAEPTLATRTTLWFHNPCNIRKKCHVASASKNIPRVLMQ